MQQEIAAIEAAASAVKKIEREGRTAVITLSNGIRIRCRPIPPLLLNALNDSFPLPDPPQWHNDDKGRDEENPNDPEWLRECEKIRNAQDLAINNLILLGGTSVVEVPEGYDRPEDDGWLADVRRLAGPDFQLDADDKDQRYLAWLRYYAMENGSDAALVGTIPTSLAGVRQEEVREAMESFRSDTGRTPDNGSASTPNGTDGNPNNRAARRAGQRTGRARSR